jgi:endonuclease-8
MPEGDTIFRSARTLHRALAGAVVTGFETAYAQLASVNDNAPVIGRTIERVESRGKWMLIYFSGDLILLTHMRMHGSWHIYRRGERWQRPRGQMRVVITTEHVEAVAFQVPVAEFHTARSLQRHSTLFKLGPDVLGSSFHEDEAALRLRVRANEEIANVLLNQQVMAGIGNIYKSEICFACSIHPFRLVSSLAEHEIQCLLETARRILSANIRESSDQRQRLWVYRRQGRPCRRCGTVILMRRQGPGGRSTYWCPECQPMNEAGPSTAS